MSYAHAKTLDIEMIPIIDISPLKDGTNPILVAKQLHKASKGLGFIYIKGHGIPDNAITVSYTHLTLPTKRIV